MYSTFEVTTPSTESNLTTLAQLKADLNLDDSQDTLLNRVIALCSNEISVYLRGEFDEAENASLGRETIRETFYDIRCEKGLRLGRRPVASITSVQEGSAPAISRLIGNSDGAITATDNTFTSAGGPGDLRFSESYVGKSITVVGAGASGADLATTVASVTSETEIELTDAAATTVSGATWTVENPSFTYVIRKQGAQLHKRIGDTTAMFLTSPVRVVYVAGWLLPGETGRNLPLTIEDACVLFCRRKIDQLQEGEDFSGPLTAASVDGVGNFQFGSTSSLERGYGLPMEVRALLDRYREPVFA